MRNGSTYVKIYLGQYEKSYVESHREVQIEN